MEGIEGDGLYFLAMYNAELTRHSIKCISFVQAHVEDIQKTHLRDLLSNDERCRSMMVYGTLRSYIIL